MNSNLNISATRLNLAYAKLFYSSIIILLGLLVYGWTIFEPLAGDALMHVMDANRIESVREIFTRLLGLNSVRDPSTYRLDVFFRPVFNDLYISTLKSVFGVSPLWYRISTLVLQCSSCLLIFFLFLRLGFPVVSSFCGAIAVLFAPPLFFGMYDFGISFSQLLVFLAVSSLSASTFYVNSNDRLLKFFFGALTLLLSFLVVFTKESAALWPFAIIIFIVFQRALAFDGKLFKGFFDRVCHLWRHAISLDLVVFISLATISILYFFLRFQKFGSLTAIAAGIEGQVTGLASVEKAFAYLLYAVGIPTKIIPPYLSVEITEISGLELLCRILLISLFLVFGYKSYRNYRSVFYSSFFIIAVTFLPILKVTRNSPYYGDLMSIGIAFIVVSGASVIQSKSKKFVFNLAACIFVTCSVGQVVYLSQRYVFDQRMWLAQSQGMARAALSDVASVEAFANASALVQTGSVADSGSNWALHHNSQIVGSGFIANLGVSPSKFKLLRHDQPLLPDTLFYEFNRGTELKAFRTGGFPRLGRISTAYFPGEIVKNLLEGEGSLYPLKAEKLIRIECERQLNTGSPVNFSIDFTTGSSESIISRLVDETFNISTEPSKFVALLVVPLTSSKFALKRAIASNCPAAKIYGYAAVLLSSSNFSKQISNDPYFNDPRFWIGNIERVDGGILVGPGINAGNTLLQKIDVLPGKSYLATAEVSSLKGGNQGRLQVNWHSKNETYLSSTSSVFKVSEQVSTVELFTRAPTDAVYGVLYVTPFSESDRVIFKRASLNARSE